MFTRFLRQNIAYAPQVLEYINVLVDFASQINFSHHSYIKQNQRGFALSERKNALSKF